MGRKSYGVIKMTFGDLGRSDQGQLLKNRVSWRDSAQFTIKHVYEVMGRELNGVISLTFGDLERSDQGHLLKTGSSAR